MWPWASCFSSVNLNFLLCKKKRLLLIISKFSLQHPNDGFLLFKKFWLMITMLVPLIICLPGCAQLCQLLVVPEVWMPSTAKTQRMKLSILLAYLCFLVNLQVPLSKTKRLLLLLLSHFSHVWLCATPSLGFSRQEHWSGLPFPSPMNESEKWKWSRSVVSDSSGPHGLQPTRLLRPWDFPGKSTGVGCHCLLWNDCYIRIKIIFECLEFVKMCSTRQITF